MIKFVMLALTTAGFIQVCAAEVSGQLVPRDYPLQGVENWSIESDSMKLSFDISVALPTGHEASSDTYPAVFVLDGNGSEPKVRLQDIEVGQVLGNTVAVTAGLKPGARVVVYGATLVTDGEQVRVIP